MSEITLRWKLEKEMMKDQPMTWVLRIEHPYDFSFLTSPTSLFEKLIVFPQIPIFDLTIYDQLAQFSKERYSVKYSQVQVWIEYNDWTNPKKGDYYYITDYMTNYDPMSDF